MSTQNNKPILIIRAKGPATKDGRLPLADLLKIGKSVQNAVERVARVLVGQADSRRRGRKPKDIANECSLEVVALNRGSFEIALDLPRTKLEPMDLGVEAVECLLEGFERIGTSDEAQPRGYDTGVLYSLREWGGIFSHGIEEIEVESETLRLHRRQFSFNQNLYNRVLEQIRRPISTQRTIEGRLLMADFRLEGEKCRIHPPVGKPIICYFDESLAETVHELLRGYVRITGETTEDPQTGRIESIQISDVEALLVEDEVIKTITAEEFWQEKNLEQLAVEQDISPIQQLEEVLGKGSDLWDNDEDFEAFLEDLNKAKTEGIS